MTSPNDRSKALTEAREHLCQAHAKLDSAIGGLSDLEHGAAIMARAGLTSLISRLGNIAVISSAAALRGGKKDAAQGET